MVDRPTSDPLRWTAGLLRDGRRFGVSSEERPRCLGSDPDHPHLLKLPPDTRMPITEGIVRCQHRPRRHGEPCRMQAYYALVTVGPRPQARGEGERIWLAVEVTPAHVERMYREPMIFLEKLSLLSVTMPGVDLDLQYVAELPGGAG